MRIAIIGAGISGLACAQRLSKGLGDKAEVIVYEAQQAAGGVTVSERHGPFLLELGPDSMLSSKPASLELIRELGLEGEIISTRPPARRSLIARGRQLVPVPEGVYLMAPGRLLPFARSPLISWPGKIRMAADLLLPRRSGDDDESLATFVRRRLGREGLQRLAQPLIGGIYTARPERLSLAATMPQFIDMEREHRSLILAMRARSRQMAQAGGVSGPRYGLFITLRNGLGSMTQALRERVSPFLHSGVPVRSCRSRADGRWLIDSEHCGEDVVDHVVLALPAHRAASLLDPSDSLTRLLAGIAYADIATINCAFRAQDIERLPEAAGFVVPAIDHQAMIACTFVHHKYDHRAPAGTVLLRAFCGGAMHPEDLDHGDDALCARVLGELNWRFGIKAAPLFTRISRWPRAMAQYEVGHQRRCDLIDAALHHRPGLHIIGNGLRGVGIPDVVSQGWAVAERITTAHSKA